MGLIICGASYAISRIASNRLLFDKLLNFCPVHSGKPISRNFVSCISYMKRLSGTSLTLYPLKTGHIYDGMNSMPLIQKCSEIYLVSPSCSTTFRKSPILYMSAILSAQRYTRAATVEALFCITDATGFRGTSWGQLTDLHPKGNGGQQHVSKAGAGRRR
jgi:hypothetical protein